MAAKSKVPRQECNELVARIDTCAFSYSISDHRLASHRVDDEALLNLSARIETIGEARSSLLGSVMDITLACSRSYRTEEPGETGARPMLSSLSLRNGRCGALVYLPSEVFWGLRPLLSGGQLKSVAITYGRPRYGSADLITLAFA